MGECCHKILGSDVPHDLELKISILVHEKLKSSKDKFLQVLLSTQINLWEQDLNEITIKPKWIVTNVTISSYLNQVECTIRHLHYVTLTIFNEMHLSINGHIVK